ncbi:hypothetical protein LTR95_015573 [Oleoguttula sp. CCFEE 5521]
MDSMPDSLTHVLLNFYQAGGKGIEEIIVGSPKTNDLDFNSHLVEIRDARGHEVEFKLDVQGFEFLHAPSSFANFDNSAAIKGAYYAEVAAFMRAHLNASLARPINQVLRSSDPSTPGARPAKFLHSDWSYAGAVHNLDSNPDYQPPKWSHLRQSHWAAYSVWRPLTPVTRDALVLADRRTVPDSDLRPYKSSYQNGTASEGNALALAEGQGFWWWSGMRVGEGVVIKLFDSKLDGTARCAPRSEGDWGGRLGREAECGDEGDSLLGRREREVMK